MTDDEDEGATISRRQRLALAAADAGVKHTVYRPPHCPCGMRPEDPDLQPDCPIHGETPTLAHFTINPTGSAIIAYDGAARAWSWYSSTTAYLSHGRPLRCVGCLQPLRAADMLAVQVFAEGGQMVWHCGPDRQCSPMPGASMALMYEQVPVEEDGFDQAMSEARRRCRVCGCTAENACPGGCRWVEEDLCSACPPYAQVAEQWRRMFLNDPPDRPHTRMHGGPDGLWHDGDPEGPVVCCENCDEPLRVGMPIEVTVQPGPDIGRESVTRLPGRYTAAHRSGWCPPAVPAGPRPDLFIVDDPDSPSARRDDPAWPQLELAIGDLGVYTHSSTVTFSFRPGRASAELDAGQVRDLRRFLLRWLDDERL